MRIDRNDVRIRPQSAQGGLKRCFLKMPRIADENRAPLSWKFVYEMFDERLAGYIQQWFRRRIPGFSESFAAAAQQKHDLDIVHDDAIAFRRRFSVSRSRRRRIII